MHSGQDPEVPWLWESDRAKEILVQGYVLSCEEVTQRIK